MRKLASIQEIFDIQPIENADAIEKVSILGWHCVSKKGEFNIGDKCVYFEVDSFLPVDDKFEFLRAGSYKNNEYMGEGFRLKTQRFRGQISQGLALPISILPAGNYEIGDDVTDVFGVKKWDMPEMATSGGTAIGSKPFGIYTTDETRIQSIPEIVDIMQGKPYYISTKMDGTSVTYYVKDGVFGVCGRTLEYKDTDDCSFWQYAKKHSIDVNMLAYNMNIAIQGEFCGGGIQKNRLKLKEPCFFAFNVLSLDNMKYYDFEAFINTCGELNITTVPIEEVKDSFAYKTVDELLERAKGNYDSGNKKEGIVIRPLKEEYCYLLSSRLSFKVLNNDFLLKQD